VTGFTDALVGVFAELPFEADRDVLR